jgi:CHC2 zinc finger/Toprim domain
MSGRGAPRTGQDRAAAIRARVNLPALIGRDVRLARKGPLWSGLCPFHEERNPSFAVWPDHYHCFGCGAHGDALDYVMRSRRLDFRAALETLAGEHGLDAGTEAPPVPPASNVSTPARRDAHAQALWLAAQTPVWDTPVEDYLAGRAIDLRALGRAPGALRYHPSLWHAEARIRLPAMVAAITGEAGYIGTHRTWLERAGGGWVKARLGPHPNKKVLGAMSGGAIPLWRGASGRPLRAARPGETIVIAEGIETALSIACACPEFRVLAGVSLGNIGSVWLPPGAGPVVLALDNDDKPAAREQAARAVARMLGRGFDARIARPAAGKDFNDVRMLLP